LPVWGGKVSACIWLQSFFIADASNQLLFIYTVCCIVSSASTAVFTA
jgi:hypothetical protein